MNMFLLFTCILGNYFQLGPDHFRIFGADADTDIREQENSDICYIFYTG